MTGLREVLLLEVAGGGGDLREGSAGGARCCAAPWGARDLESGDLGELAVRGHGFDAELDRWDGAATGEVVEAASARGTLDAGDRAAVVDVLVAVLRVYGPGVGLADLSGQVFDDLIDRDGFVGGEDVEALLRRYTGQRGIDGAVFESVDCRVVGGAQLAAAAVHPRIGHGSDRRAIGAHVLCADLVAA